MAQLYANTTGYINQNNEITSSGVFIYLSSGMSKYVGRIEFTKSIKKVLNLDITNWEELFITSAKITLFSTAQTMPASGYTIAISKNGSLKSAFNFSNVSAIKENCTLAEGETLPKNSQIDIDITELFRSINKTSELTPSSGTWYFYIYHPTLSSSEICYFYGKNYNSSSTYDAYLTIEG